MGEAMAEKIHGSTRGNSPFFTELMRNGAKLRHARCGHR
jgi:hypothetical protein